MLIFLLFSNQILGEGKSLGGGWQTGSGGLYQVLLFETLQDIESN